MNDKITIIVLVLISAIIGSVGALLLKVGSKKIHMEFSISALIKLIKNWILLLGVVMYAMASIFFILALRIGELSVVYPLTSLSYVFITLLSMYYLNEHMNKYKWWGIVLIILGVVLVKL